MPQHTLEPNANLTLHFEIVSFSLPSVTVSDMLYFAGKSYAYFNHPRASCTKQKNQATRLLPRRKFMLLLNLRLTIYDDIISHFLFCGTLNSLANKITTISYFMQGNYETNSGIKINIMIHFCDLK